MSVTVNTLKILQLHNCSCTCHLSKHSCVLLLAEAGGHSVKRQKLTTSYGCPSQEMCTILPGVSWSEVCLGLADRSNCHTLGLLY